MQNKTIDISTLIEKLRSQETVTSGTPIYFTMHDLVLDEKASEVGIDVLVHIPTGAKVIYIDDPFNYEYDPDIYLVLPGTTKKIWIAEDIHELFRQAMSEDGDICAFEIPYLDERIGW